MNRTADNRSQAPSVLTVKLADRAREIEQAMRLRYKVFVEEEKTCGCATEPTSNGTDTTIIAII